MSKEVENMFSNIASRYDLANDLLSFGMHRLWRKTLVRFADIKPGETVIDLCTGTGDLAFDIAKRTGKTGKVLGLDFSAQMLNFAKQKQRRKVAHGDRIDASLNPALTIDFLHGDATATKLDGGIADTVTVSFGIRNTDSPIACLQEMKRLLKPGGKAVVLEFGQATTPVFAPLFNWYSRHIMPRIGGFVTGNRPAYEYLPRTSAAFPAGEAFVKLMLEAGLQEPRIKPLMGGVAYIYIAQAPQAHTDLAGANHESTNPSGLKQSSILQ